MKRFWLFLPVSAEAIGGIIPVKQPGRCRKWP